MNAVGKNIAALYSCQGLKMRLSHVQYSIMKSHHPPLQAGPQPSRALTLPEGEEIILQRGDVFQLFGKVRPIYYV